MRTTRHKLLLACLVAVLATLLGTASALAISVPDEGPYIIKVEAYRHLLEADDLLLHVRYNWPYAAAPSETITQAVFARLLDGTTELAYCSPYSYYNRGWGYGSLSMYLTASEASGLWEDALTVEMRGSPTLDWTGGSNYVVSTSTILWRATTTSEATQALMYSHFISWADTLGDYWSVALVTQYAEGNKFSEYGEAYFTNVVPGLRVMVPQLFSGAVETPTYQDIDYSIAGSTAMRSNWPFDFGGISSWLGLPESDEVFRTLVAFVVIFIIGMVMVRQGVPTAAALFACFALLFVLAVPGLVSIVLVGGVVFVVVLLTGVVFLLRRSM